MEPALSVTMTSSAKSLIERAYTDAIAQTDDGDQSRARLLDAAYELFCHRGIQRTSMEEVARRAKLSRITLYRKFDTKDALVEQLVIRELRRYFVRFIDDIRAAQTPAERVVVGFVSSLRAIGGNPLIDGLLQTELTFVVDALMGDDGGLFTTVQQFVAGQLRREQHAGTISSDLDAELVAEMMVRISTSFLTLPSRVVDITDDDQLAAIARQFLVPMLEPAAATD